MDIGQQPQPQVAPHGGSYGGYRSYGGYNDYSPYSSPSSSSSGSSSRSGSSGSNSTKPRWSRAGSPVVYTYAQVQSLTPIRETVEARAVQQPQNLRDVFLCHAWDDRQGVARELHDLLEAAGVKVWFSEGPRLGRSYDAYYRQGLANSRIGLVLVTPALLKRLPNEGVADKELSALLASNQLVPIVHNTTYDALRNVSPLLASRSGLDTGEDSMSIVAQKIAELVAI